MSDVLVATWTDGIFVVGETGCEHELAGCSVQALTASGAGAALAIVNEHTLRQRRPDGDWTTLATSPASLSCCVAFPGSVFVGTNDARVLRLSAEGQLVELDAFERVRGRETWTAGQVLVEGRLLGPPLGVRSISTTAEGVLLANVHVGGIARSSDGGASWHPTIAVETDVHEVRAHPTRPNVVAAASAFGLCTSDDGGLTWRVSSDGLHAPHCSAVAFVGADVFVSASRDPFDPTGRVYRRPIGQSAPLCPVDGLPEWTRGTVDTYCIAASGSRVACWASSASPPCSRTSTA